MRDETLLRDPAGISSTSFSDSVKFSANPGESAMIKRKLKHDMQDAQEIENGHSLVVVVGIQTQRCEPQIGRASCRERVYYSV